MDSIEFYAEKEMDFDEQDDFEEWLESEEGRDADTLAITKEEWEELYQRFVDASY